jgi:cell division cycle 20-like protein 1, cofactor of APC complex
MRETEGEALNASIEAVPSSETPQPAVGTKTPPLRNSNSAKRLHSYPIGSTANVLDRGRSANGDAPDPDALSKALMEFEEAGRQRERTPGGSPSRKRQRVYNDRWVLQCS